MGLKTVNDNLLFVYQKFAQIQHEISSNAQKSDPVNVPANKFKKNA